MSGDVPTREELVAYVMGKLPANELEAMSGYLEDHPESLAVLDELPAPDDEIRNGLPVRVRAAPWRVRDSVDDSRCANAVANGMHFAVGRFDPT